MCSYCHIYCLIDNPQSTTCAIKLVTGMYDGPNGSFFHLRNEFHFSDVHGAMNHSGSRAKWWIACKVVDRVQSE